MISIIICSAQKNLRDAVTLNIKETIGIGHEIIIIENELQRLSISTVYNIGASKAKFPYLCFVHEDIKFHTESWGEILIKNFLETQARLIGFVGSTIKTKYPSSVYITGSPYNRQYHLQRWPDKSVTKSHLNPNQEFYSEVCVLDGLFIASTKKAWEETKFSEDYLKGFHGYDIDFSLKNFFLGKNIVIYNILIEHFSLGSFSKEWVDTQIELINLWESKLPAHISSATKKDIKIINRLSVEQLMIIMVSVKYNLFIEGKLFLLQLMYSPFSKWNFYLIIRRVLTKKGWDLFKTVFTKKTNYLSKSTKN